MASISATIAASRLPSPFASRIRLQKRAELALRCRAGPSPQIDSEGSAKDSRWGISTNTLSAGLASVGFLETTYLTYLKLTGSEAFCPVGGGSCADVLNSDYSVVFGVPLPLLGMVAYGLVALLALQQTGKHMLLGPDENNVRLIMLGTTTSMATASGYFLYLLITNFAGASCSYCLVSALLSFALFIIAVKDFGMENIRNVAGLQLAIASIVVIALTSSYTTATTQLISLDDFTLEPYETEIKKESTAFSISLAKHLRSIGAKMYGAFWCSHCNEQKEMFGSEAAKMLDYVECFPNGAGKGRMMAPECTIMGLEGFPTWIIKDKILSGEQDLSALAEAAGFAGPDANPS